MKKRLDLIKTIALSHRQSRHNLLFLDLKIRKYFLLQIAKQNREDEREDNIVLAEDFGLEVAN